jgi:hypothetical protein
MSFFVAPFIRDLTVYYAPTEVAAVWLGCGQQIVKKKTPFIKFYANLCDDSGVMTCVDRHFRFP